MLASLMQTNTTSAFWEQLRFRRKAALRKQPIVHARLPTRQIKGAFLLAFEVELEISFKFFKVTISFI